MMGIALTSDVAFNLDQTSGDHPSVKKNPPMPWAPTILKAEIYI